MSDIKPLEDMESDRLKLLLHGRPGTGKTATGSTIAQRCKLLYIDLPGEKGIKTIKHTPYRKNILVARPKTIERISELFWDVQTGEIKVDAVMIESLSALQKMYIRYILGNDEQEVKKVERNPKVLDQQGWGKVLDFMTDQVVFWYNLADAERDDPKHVIFTSQSKVVEDDETGEEEVTVDVSRGSQAIALAAPDYVGYTFIEEGESEALDEEPPMNFCVRFGPHPVIRTKMREDVDTEKPLPAVLGRNGSRVTVPKICKRLEIPL